MKALVAGSGVAGISCAKLLLSQGYKVILFDENTSRSKEEICEKIGADIDVVLGELSAKAASGAEFCVMSPGINPLKAAFVKVLEAENVPYISEIELAYRYDKGRVAAITGTNGKTTTTALLGQICEQGGAKTFVVGNIGHAYAAEALNSTPDSISVLEIAGFHLQTCDKFRPHVSAILNITPDHLDRFGSMEAYAASKHKITANQTEDDFCILNYEDEDLREYANNVKAKVLFFSSTRELEEGAFLRDEEIVLRLGGEEIVFGTIYDMTLLGKHNYENVMAAVLMALCLGINIDSIRESVKTFKAVEHRIEFVVKKDGVVYYNDSKGTNPDAAAQAIKAMVCPTVLIAGGYDKHVEFDEWILACEGKVKRLILIGESAAQIAATCKKYGFRDYEFAKTFEEAVDAAIKAAEPGDAVLLSPACASWDMFKNYEQRGEIFKELVRR